MLHSNSLIFLCDCLLQETSDKSVIELQQYAKKNKPNLHILNKLQEEMRKLAQERVCVFINMFSPKNLFIVLFTKLTFLPLIHKMYLKSVWRV